MLSVVLSKISEPILITYVSLPPSLTSVSVTLLTVPNNLEIKNPSVVSFAETFTLSFDVVVAPGGEFFF